MSLRYGPFVFASGQALWHQIDEICRVLAHLYTLPKAQFIPVCKGASQSGTPADPQTSALRSSVPPGVNLESDGCKDALIKSGLDNPNDSTKSNDDPKSMSSEREEIVPKSRAEHRTVSRSDHKTESSGERIKGKERERERSRLKATDRDRGRDFDREKLRRHLSRDRDYYGSSYSSREREKDRDRHHSQA